MKPIIVVHGGVGCPRSCDDGTLKAARAALKALNKTRSPMRAAVSGAVVLEDDPRFDCGYGSFLRIDGRTVEMDASVMDSDGNFGAVACIQKIRNPSIVAELVSKSPHLMFCGQGAIDFARQHKVPVFDLVAPKARRRYLDTLRFLARKKSVKQKRPRVRGCDTIGVLVSDGRGKFAGVNSTGGVSYMMLGRVGDAPIMGCGLYVGPHGAVAATGQGEEIIRQVLSLRVYDRIAGGMAPQAACEWALTLYKNYRTSDLMPYKKIPIGVAAVTLTGYGIAATHQMASSVID